MTKIFVTVLMGVGLVWCTVINCFAGVTSKDVSVGFGEFSGDSTYQIGGYASSNIHGAWVQRDPTSELMFPLDVNLVSLKGDLTFDKNWSLSAEIKNNILDDNAGSMEDSDWGVWYSRLDWWNDPNSLDVFSKSDAELDALIMDINIRYRVPMGPNWRVLGGAGLIYQNFDYEVSDSDQWSPSRDAYYGYDTGHNLTYGNVLDYEVTYLIPYLEIGVFLFKGEFNVELFAGYSPYVKAEDEDRHLLRSMKSEGDCDGDAFMFSIKGGYDFSKKIFFSFRFDQTQIDTDGNEKFISYEDIEDNGVPEVGKIEKRIESDQQFVLLSVGYRF